MSRPPSPPAFQPPSPPALQPPSPPALQPPSTPGLQPSSPPVLQPPSPTPTPKCLVEVMFTCSHSSLSTDSSDTFRIFKANSLSIKIITLPIIKIHSPTCVKTNSCLSWLNNWIDLSKEELIRILLHRFNSTLLQNCYKQLPILFSS